jgi:hypothetical protein
MCKKERKPNRECKKPSKLKVFQRAHTYWVYFDHSTMNRRSNIDLQS